MLSAVIPKSEIVQMKWDFDGQSVVDFGIPALQCLCGLAQASRNQAQIAPFQE
jgi:hypothetical protein